MAASWIAGITTGDDGRLCAHTQEGGTFVRTSLVNVSPDIDGPGTVRRKATLALHELKPVSTTEYLAGLGLEHLCPDGQPTYEATADIGILVIPAQLLVMATLGTQRILRRHLLTPYGAEAIGTAHLCPHGLFVHPTPNRLDGVQTDLHALKRLEWILAYPSASAAWGSVYWHGIHGRFDMRMPRAEVEVSLHAIKVRGRWLVTKLKLMRLVPVEQPAEFAQEHARSEFVFNEALNRRPDHGKAAAPTGDGRISALRGRGALTDAQWRRVEPVLLADFNARYPGSPRRHTRRETLDVILLKVGTPYAWSQVPAEHSLKASASVMLSHLKRSGRWERVIDALNDAPQSIAGHE